MRALYRSPWIEFPIFALFVSQIVLGLCLILKRGRPQGRWAWAQVFSGGYLALSWASASELPEAYQAYVSSLL